VNYEKKQKGVLFMKHRVAEAADRDEARKAEN